MEKRIVFLFLIACVMSVDEAATITCPTLTCSTLLNGQWYKHSGTNPVTNIYLTACATGTVCPLTDGEYAWINAPMQQYSSGTTSQSQVYKKIIAADCLSADAYYGSNLNNGRKCISDNDCISRTCTSSTWVGKEVGEPCANHYECSAKLACRRSYIWPFTTACQTWASAGSNCIDDYDCDPTCFCGYESASDVSTSTTKCMTKYSAEEFVTFGWVTVYNDNLKDALHNGQYCRSGYAYKSTTNTATCMSVIKVTDQSNVTLASPYACVPTDTTNKCRYFGDSTNYIETECECSLDGNGYCPKPPTTSTEKFITNIKYVYGNSTCHTLDKNDLNAQLECGIGFTDEWKNAVEYKFYFDYYPFLQNSTLAECIESTFPMSLTVLVNSKAANYFSFILGIASILTLSLVM